MDYEDMRDTVQWERSQGESEIPGRRTYAPAQKIPARKEERIATIGVDRVANLIVAVLPEHTVHAADKLDGAEVLEVASMKDLEGNVQRWVCYAKA